MHYNENKEIDYTGLKNIFSRRIVRDHNLYQEILKNKHFLFLAPHPDDEIIGCGGLIQKLIRDGFECEVVYCTYNEQDPRGKEAIAVMNEIGVEHIKFLGLPDQKINVKSRKAIINELLKEKRHLICVPSIFETHEDHLNVTKAVLEYCDILEDDIKILMYEVWVPQLNNGYVPLNEEEYIRKIKLVNNYKTQCERYNLVSLVQAQHTNVVNKHNMYEVFNLLDKKQFSLLVKRKAIIGEKFENR